MSEKLTKKLVKQLMKMEGEARGMHLKSDGNYVLREKGEEGLTRLEDELVRLGCPLRYGEINNMAFYPIGMRAISLLGMSQVFGWGDEDIRNACGYAAPASLIVKLYMKFFYSIPKILEKAPRIWKEYFTRGELEVVDYSEGEGRLIIRINNFSLHPIYCRCLEGYLKRFARMVARAEKITSRETKCVFKGDDCHEFLMEWEWRK